MDEEKNRAFVDTNVFLYSMQAHPVYGNSARKILENIDRGERAVISLINLAEICWWLEKHNSTEKIEENLNLIFSILNLDIAPLTLEDFVAAARYVKEYSIDFNDCLCIAVMHRLHIKKIYSNDLDFDRVKWIERIF